MPRFFLSASNIADGTVTISGDDAVHISRSLRMKKGEHICVCDMQKNEYDCEIEEFTQDKVYAAIKSVKKNETEPPYEIRLYQALPKSGKLDTIIQKAVECGANVIIPFESERTIVKADASKEDKKTERRNKIAAEAAKQCGRGSIPEVRKTVGYKEMLNEAAKADLRLFFYEGDGTVSLRKYLTEKYPSGAKGIGSISVVIGAEGGFSIAETEAAKEAGFELCGLGKRILRCETAPSFALACIAFWLEM